MKSYEKYAPSGVEWIGEIPEGWKVKRIKYIAKSPLMYGANESPDIFDETQPRYIRITDIDDNGKLREDSAVSLEMEKAKPYLLKKDDILFARSGATVGKSYIFNEETISCFAGYMIKFEPDKAKVNPRFVYYNTLSKMYSNWIESNTIQATIQNVSAEKYKNFSIALPELEIQHAIVDYLDHEIAKIESLLRTKETLIERLKEKRIALITHAVTKGLNKNDKMKSSGIDWIGDIPESWIIKKLKYVACVNQKTLLENTAPNYEFRYVDIGSVNLEEGITEYSEMVFEDAPSRARRIVENGDTIVSTVRTYLKAIAKIEDDKDVIVSTGFAVVKPQKINSNFFSYVLRSSYFVETVTANSVGVSYPATNASDIMQINICFPDDEAIQESIADHLDCEVKKIDAIVDKTVLSIEKLKELRTAIISACVTGKFDVRSV